MTADPNAARLPLLAARDLQAPLAWRDGRACSGRRFLAEAQALAQALPEGAPVINLCRDRLDFAVGLAAALLRGQPSLLPPNALPATLASLHAAHGPCTVLGEPSAQGPGLQALAWAGVDLSFAGPPGPPPAAGGQAPELPAEQAAVVLLTSGSTGAPVPHARRWGAVVENARAQAQRLEEALGLPQLQGLCLVATVPAQHSYGFESSVTLAWQSGASLDAGRPFYPADIVAALERVPRPRGLVTTPFHLKTLLDAGLALPPVDVLLCATAPLSPQLAAEAEVRLQGPLVEVYGCTEVGQVATRRPTRAPTWQTYGALRIHLDRSPAAPGEPGERFIVSGGYAPEPTVLADLLELDDDRHFRLLGRAGDLIHVAGKRSSLAHLNYHLNSIPGVRDGACWMPADAPDGIVRPVAFVVAPSLSAAQVAAALRERLEAVFVPRRIVMLESLPREATGKLTAATLERLARTHARQRPS